MKFFFHIIFIIFAVVLQVSLIPQFSLYRAVFNLVLLLVISLNFIKREQEGLIWVFLGGMLLDLFSPVRFAVYFFTLLLIYLITYLLIKRFLTTPSWYLAGLFFFTGSIILDLPWFIFFNSREQPSLLLYNALYNTTLGILVYYLLSYYYQPKENIKI